MLCIERWTKRIFSNLVKCDSTQKLFLRAAGEYHPSPNKTWSLVQWLSNSTTTGQGSFRSHQGNSTTIGQGSFSCYQGNSTTIGQGSFSCHQGNSTTIGQGSFSCHQRRINVNFCSLCLRVTQKDLQLPVFFFFSVSFSSIVLDGLAKPFYVYFIDFYPICEWPTLD